MKDTRPRTKTYLQSFDESVIQLKGAFINLFEGAEALRQASRPVEAGRVEILATNLDLLIQSIQKTRKDVIR